MIVVAQAPSQAATWPQQREGPLPLLTTDHWSVGTWKVHKSSKPSSRITPPPWIHSRLEMDFSLPLRLSLDTIPKASVKQVTCRNFFTKVHGEKKNKSSHCFNGILWYFSQAQDGLRFRPSLRDSWSKRATWSWRAEGPLLPVSSSSQSDASTLKRQRSRKTRTPSQPFNKLNDFRAFEKKTSQKMVGEIFVDSRPQIQIRYFNVLQKGR